MTTQNSNSKTVAGKAGKFTVYSDGSYTGPASYMATVDQDKIVKSSILLGQASPGTPILQIVAVALQTDYAAWLGMQEAKGWMKGGK
mgnify:CR=1 FL=1